MSPFLAFGAAPGILLDAKHSTEINSEDVLHRLDLGLVGSIGGRLALTSGLHITVEARGVYGVADMFTHTSHRNRSVFLSVALAYDRAPRHPEPGELRGAEYRDDGPAVEIIENGTIGLRFRLDRPGEDRIAEDATPILVGGKPRVTRLTRGPHIGYIYRIEGYLNGQRVVYIGSATNIKRRLINDARYGKHDWAQLLRQKSTIVDAKKVHGTLNIEASAGKKPGSAVNEALRSMEEPELKRAEKRVEKENRNRKPGQKRTRVVNKIRASNQPELWQARHQTSRQRRWHRIKHPGLGIRLHAVGGGLLLLGVYHMYREDKLSRYVMAPYVLEDEHGAFTLSYEKGILGGLFSTSYFKRYLAGRLKGKKIQVSDSEE